MTESLSNAKTAYDTKNELRDSASQATIVYNYALCLEKAGRQSEAIPYYSEALKLNPNHLKSKINLGVMYLNMNPSDPDSALVFFNQAYRQDPNNFEVNNNMGNAYLAKKDYKNAVMYYQNALKIDGQNKTAWSNLAQAYASDGQFNNAKSTYTELLKIDSTNWDAYIDLAKVCISLGDTTSARSHLTTVRTRQPAYRKAEVDSLMASLSSLNSGDFAK